MHHQHRLAVLGHVIGQRVGRKASFSTPSERHGPGIQSRKNIPDEQGQTDADRAGQQEGPPRTAARGAAIEGAVVAHARTRLTERSGTNVSLVHRTPQRLEGEGWIRPSTLQPTLTTIRELPGISLRKMK